MERLKAHYLLETPLDPESAAAAIAGEQSSGTFVAVPGETEELKELYAAKVDSVEFVETVNTPSLPGARGGNGEQFHRANVTVSWNVNNFGDNLPTLISTIQGNLYELSQLSGLKLIDIDVPPGFASGFPGPAFGISGTRQACGAHANRPLIGTIIKPSIGMSPEDTASLVKTLVEAGVDFIKDDELMANPPHSPFAKRVAAIMDIINRHAQSNGKKVMYAANITDELDRMQAHYDTIIEQGGTCAMVSLNSAGLTGVKKICDRRELLIHGHRNGWGMLNRHSYFGMAFPAYQKIWRLAGVDQLHVNGIQNKFWEPDESVVKSIKSCLEPLHQLAPLLPVVSSGQWGGQAPETWKQTRTTELLYMAGGGIMAHPGGPAAGVSAIQQAWDCAMKGIPLQEAAKSSPELRAAIEKFGN